RILTEHGLAKSRSEAERLIKQGAIEWNKTIIRDASFVIQIRQSSPPNHWILKVGKKRFLKFYAE
ncbi:MAG: S4 domain-containing protein, partial [Candidatus Acidiferrales bacterium]